MHKEMTHEEFILYATLYDINIKRITRDAVHLDVQPARKKVELPNVSRVRVSMPILPEWEDEHYEGVIQTLKAAILDKKVIATIKIIRKYTGLGLVDSRDVVMVNWDAWRCILAEEDS